MAVTAPSRQKRRLIAYLLFTGLVVFGLWYSSHRADVKARNATVSGCKRVNIQREAIGSLIETSQLEAIQRGDRLNALRYAHLGDLLELAAVAGLNHAPRDGVYKVDCEAAFPKP